MPRLRCVPWRNSHLVFPSDSNVLSFLMPMLQLIVASTPLDLFKKRTTNIAYGRHKYHVILTHFSVQLQSLVHFEINSCTKILLSPRPNVQLLWGPRKKRNRPKSGSGWGAGKRFHGAPGHGYCWVSGKPCAAGAEKGCKHASGCLRLAHSLRRCTHGSRFL